MSSAEYPELAITTTQVLTTTVGSLNLVTDHRMITTALSSLMPMQKRFADTAESQPILDLSAWIWTSRGQSDQDHGGRRKHASFNREAAKPGEKAEVRAL